MPQLFLSSFNYSNFFLGISVSKEFIKVTCPMSQIKMATLKEVLQIFAVSLNNVRRTVSGSRGTWTRFDFSSPMTGGRSSASLAQACCQLIATFLAAFLDHISLTSNHKHHTDFLAGFMVCFVVPHVCTPISWILMTSARYSRFAFTPLPISYARDFESSLMTLAN